MREVEYKDDQGFLYRVLIPDNAPQEHAELGVRLGPPGLDGLDLTLDQKVRLNNELYHRRLLTKQEVRRRHNEITSSVQDALKETENQRLTLYGTGTQGE